MALIQEYLRISEDKISCFCKIGPFFFAEYILPQNIH